MERKSSPQRTRETEEVIIESRVWTTVTYTVNLGNYENVKIEAGRSRTVGPDEDPDELRNEMTRTILRDVVEQGERAYKSIKGD